MLKVSLNQLFQISDVDTQALTLLVNRYHIPEEILHPWVFFADLLAFRNQEQLALNLNAYHRSDEEMLDQCIRNILSHLHISCPDDLDEKQTECLTRQAFRNQLQEYAFYTTLQLLLHRRAVLPADVWHRLLALLVRIYLQAGVALKAVPTEESAIENGYASYHAFDQIVQQLVELFQSTESVFQATWSALAIPDESQLLTEFTSQDLHTLMQDAAERLHTGADLQRLSQRFSTLVALFSQRRRRKSQNLRMKNSAKHRSAFESRDGDQVEVQHLEGLDDEDTDAEPASLTEFSWQPDSETELTPQQKKWRYQKAKAGLDAAIKRKNQPLAAKMDVLSVLELRQFVQSQSLDELDMVLLSTKDPRSKAERQQELRHRLLFWLTLLTGRSAASILSLHLYNELNKDVEGEGNKDLPIKDVYAYNKKIDSVFFSTDVARVSSLDLSTSSSDTIKKMRLPVSGRWSIRLPAPVEHFFMALIRQHNARPYHRVVLKDFLQTDEAAYRRWLRQKIKQFRQTSAIPVSSAAIQNSFIQFLQSSVPAVLVHALRNQTCVQSYYLCLETEYAETLLAECQKNFFDLITAEERRASMMLTHLLQQTETALPDCSQTRYRQLNRVTDNIGSQALLHSLHRYIEHYGQQLLSLLKAYRSRSNASVSLHEQQILLQELSWHINAYLFFRLGGQQALRPVNRSLSEPSQFSAKRGLGFSFDKDAHRNGRPRVLTFTDGTAQLLAQCLNLLAVLQKSSDRAKKSDSANHHALMFFDAEQGQWRPFQRSDQEQAIRTLLNIAQDDPVDRSAGLLRHYAGSQLARRWLHNQRNLFFDQAALNFQMNHYRRGEYPIAMFQTASIQQCVNAQAERLEALSECDDRLKVPFFSEKELLQLDAKLSSQVEGML